MSHNTVLSFFLSSFPARSPQTKPNLNIERKNARKRTHDPQMTYGYALDTHSQVGFYRECLTHEKRFFRMGLSTSQRLFPTAAPTGTGFVPRQGSFPPAYPTSIPMPSETEPHDTSSLPPVNNAAARPFVKEIPRATEPRHIPQGIRLSPLKVRSPSPVHTQPAFAAPVPSASSPIAAKSPHRASPKTFARPIHS